MNNGPQSARFGAIDVIMITELLTKLMRFFGDDEEPALIYIIHECFDERRTEGYSDEWWLR